MKKVFILFGIIVSTCLLSAQQADYRNSNLPVELRVDDLIKRLSLQEKVNQLSCVIFSQFQGKTIDEKIAELEKFAPGGMGMIAVPSQWCSNPKEIAETYNKIHRLFKEKSRLGIPIIIHEEGCHGYVASGATSFPIPPALSSTWNPSLVRKVFSIAGREVRLCGGNMVFTPVLDLAREQRWGRCEESYGEDPYLVSQMGIACVTGYQGPGAPFLDNTHVAATLKHYTAHGSPEAGLNTGPTKEDFNTVENIHQLPFNAAITQGKAMAVMAAYSEFNGIPMHQSKYYLTDVLRSRWGFDGVVVSDWYGIGNAVWAHRTAKDANDAAISALRAGVDLETPERIYYKELDSLVRAGAVSEGYIDRALRRVLTMKFRMGIFENPYVDPAAADKTVGNEEARGVALSAAQEAVVLLKNDNHTLPLDKSKIKTIAIIGPHADYCELGGYSGTPKQKTTIFKAVQRKAGKNINVLFAEGIHLFSENQKGEDTVVLEDPAENVKRIKNAVDTAAMADAVVLCLGGHSKLSREAWSTYHLGDNSSLELKSSQNDLVREILKTGKPVIVCIFNGAPLSFEYIADHVQALFECFYLGQEAGDAVANILFGDVNPSGKLPVTIARNVGQLPVFYNKKSSARNRGYVTGTEKPLFPFGFGLSYTTFDYKNLKIDKIANSDTAAVVSIDVMNSGKTTGKEIVQMYIQDKVSSAARPVKELRDFSKIELKPGETKTVKFSITFSKLAFHNADNRYMVEAGDFDVMVGASSENLQIVNLSIDHDVELSEK